MRIGPDPRHRPTPEAVPGTDAGVSSDEGDLEAPEAPAGPIASGRDDSGQPVHRGWAPMGG